MNGQGEETWRESNTTRHTRLHELEEYLHRAAPGDLDQGPTKVNAKPYRRDIKTQEGQKQNPREACS